MKIEWLRLQNFRLFSDVTINFDPQLTVLVGVNGAGKTTILDVLAFFLQMYAGYLYRNLGAKHVISSADVKQETETIQLSCKFSSFPSAVEASYIRNNSYENGLKKIETTPPMLGEQQQFFDNDANAVPIIVYYTAKRIIEVAGTSESAHTTRPYAFVNAFTPKIDFASTQAWFIEKASQEALEAVRTNNLDHTIPELSAVRQAVAKALGDYGEPYVANTPPEIFVPPKGQRDNGLRIEQLSDGYRTMLALVMDLARRMAVANAEAVWPEGQTVLHSPGIVLIDEVELHLHPSWQQTVLPSLTAIFPNVQFIVATHSPQVLTSIEPQHIRILQDGKVFPVESSTYGAESGRVLTEVLGLKSQRPPNEVKEGLQTYFALINSGQWQSEEARTLRAELDEWLAEDPILDRADMVIRHNERVKAREAASRA